MKTPTSNIQHPEKPKLPLKAIDVCCGAGGWAFAARGLPINIIAAFDREHDCLQTYALNHPETEAVACDVRTFDFSPWHGRCDLILGGIPCEQLSVARNNTKASGLEMRLLKELVGRFLALPEEIGAPLFCYEDVVQLERLIPKRVPRFRLSSHEFSAQKRLRLYVSNLPKPTSAANGSLLGDHLRPGPFRISGRIHGKRQPKRAGKSRATFQPWLPNEKSKTVLTLSSGRDADGAVSCGEGWRQIEWQEGASLQGFPPSAIFVGSPGRVAKMIGQAVQIDTARAILSTLCNSLK